MCPQLKLSPFHEKDGDGRPLSGGTVATFIAETTTPVITYFDQEFTIPNDNPVLLNSRGEANIWFNTAIKIAIFDREGVLIKTIDNISVDLTVFGDLSVKGNSSLDGDLLVLGKGEFAGNVEIAGKLEVTGLTELVDLEVSGTSELNDLSVGGDMDVGGVEFIPFPSGTKLSFFQASAPIGWTKNTANNDKALRVVSGIGGGTGGTDGLSNPPSTLHIHATSGHVLTTSQIPAHTHTLGSGNPLLEFPPGVGDVTGASGSNFLPFPAITNATGGGVSHDHGNSAENGPLAFAPRYIDVIICAKN